MEQAVILSAVCTPIGKFMGGLSSLTAPEPGARVVTESMRQAARRRAGTRFPQIQARRR